MAYPPYVPENGIRMIAEFERHDRVFMGWPRCPETWQDDENDNIFEEVRRDIAGIANAIVEFEPVVMFADATQLLSAEEMLDPRVTVVPMVLDDLWARDMLPVFVEKTDSEGKKTLVGVDFNFNGYGDKTKHDKDQHLSSKLLEMYGIEKRPAFITSEGGALITDGRGTLFITDVSIINKNRNNQSKEEIEAELKRVLGMRKIIWLEGVADKEYTDGHVDCLVRFTEPGNIIINCAHPGTKPDHWSRSNEAAAEVLKTATDADGRPFKVTKLYEPDPKKIIFRGQREYFVPCYTNFLIGNGYVLIPKFGDDESDAAAVKVVESQFPGRKVVQCPISALGCGGGGIHCVTKEQPSFHRDFN